MIPVSYTHLDVYKRQEDDIFLNLEMLCENKIETSDRSEGAISRNDRIKAMENMVHCLLYTSLAYGKHPTQKPIRLLKRIIMASSKEGDMVFTPFSGSGSELSLIHI